MAMTKEQSKQAKVESQRRYNATHDVTALKCEKGTFDRIRALGYKSINSFAVEAIFEKLSREEK